MHKKLTTILVCIVMAGLLITACTNSEPAGQDRDIPKKLNLEDVSKPSEAMEKYSEITGQTNDQEVRDKLFRELLAWMEENGASSINVYMNIIEVTEALGKNTDPNQQDFLKIVKELNTTYMDNPEDIPDSELRDIVKTMSENGLHFVTAEGDVWPAVNYHYLEDRFGEYLSNDLQEYLNIKGDTSNILNEGYPMISWDELADTIIEMEKFMKNYTQSQEYEEVKETYHRLLSIYLTGGIQMPGQISEDLQASQQRFLSEYRDSDTYEVVKAYHELLKENDFQKTTDVQNFEANEHLEDYLQL